jgi:hypothetical protein
MLSIPISYDVHLIADLTQSERRLWGESASPAGEAGLAPLMQYPNGPLLFGCAEDIGAQLRVYCKIWICCQVSSAGASYGPMA